MGIEMKLYFFYQKHIKKDPDQMMIRANYLLWSLRNLTEENPATNHQNTTLR